ncbi:hypothetical protein ABT065_36235 [Streptomyces sp. NPDC002764]|uniref:hypothetical protein n=1 Tax=Streptomyces sp. NPDC002764 TaxID=3154428 RepID=UPI00332C589F
MSGPALHLAVEIDGDGTHPAAWRRAAHSPEQLLTPGRVAQVAAVAEHAGFTLITLDDGVLPPGAAPDSVGRIGAVERTAFEVALDTPESTGAERVADLERHAPWTAEAHGWSPRETVIALGPQRGHVGTPSGLADKFAHFVRHGAIDGFTITPYLVPDGLDDIVDLLVPELQERGVYRTEYTGTTLREHLGLRAPLDTGPGHMTDKKLSHADRNAAASGARSGLT